MLRKILQEEKRAGSAELVSKVVKGRAFAAEVDPRAKPGALTRDVNTRLSTAETDPQTKPGAPAAAPAAVDIIDTSGMPYQLTAMVTIVEGEWNDVFELIKECHFKMRRSASR